MDIKMVNVSAVLMPNGEVICMGKTIGFVGDREGQIPQRYISDAIEGRREVKLIVSGGVCDLQSVPADTEVLLLDEDNGDDDYLPMARPI